LELRLLAVVCHKDSLVAEQRAITSQGTNHAGSNFCDERNPIYRVSRRERSVLHVFRLKREPYATQGSPDSISSRLRPPRARSPAYEILQEERELATT